MKHRFTHVLAAAALVLTVAGAATSIARPDKPADKPADKTAEKPAEQTTGQTPTEGEKVVAKVGEKAPEFTLKDLDGVEHKLSDLTAEKKIVVLEWINPSCPYVKKHHADGQSTMRDLAEKYKDKDVVWMAVNSTHERHDNYKTAATTIEEWGIAYPVLNDSAGEVGHLYGAKTTPHMFIIDAEGVLRYSGAIDDHSKASVPTEAEKEKVTNYVSQALDQIIAGETVTDSETRPYGCGVKYAE